MRIFKFSLLFIVGLLALQSCQQADGNTTGSEYMPDMVHSTAIEANYYNYYYHNTWGTEEEYYEYALPKLPVEGTVSRTSGNTISIPTAVNSVTYDYGNTEEERQRAAEEIKNNPFPITDKGLESGKNLYNIYCGICHGEKGDGAGYLVRDDGGKYPAQPANLLLDNYATMSNGQYYHAIVYGKNLMGSYADKLNYKERWEVIHYIRSLQAKEFKKEYSSASNTLDEYSIPQALWKNPKMGSHEEGHDVVEKLEERAEVHNSDEHTNH